MKVQLTPNRAVENFGAPYIIAELGSNHNGDMQLAEKMIRAAKEAGADCVKFQSWSKESLFSKKIYEGNELLERDIEAYSISAQELLQMRKIADDVGIDISTSVFTKEETDFAVQKLDVPFIKIASMDVNNYPHLAYVAKQGRPVVMSLGLSTLSEIDKAIATIEGQGNTDIVLLHCVALYPPEDAQVNLNNIKTLWTAYPYPVGFSDHTLGISIPLASVALGACVIEKHFTLDKQMEGWDHKVSADAEELKSICTDSKRIQQALGGTRVVSPEGEAKRRAFQRSIVAARDIEAGEIFKEEDVAFKRPGIGLPPEAVSYIIGKPAKNKLLKDQSLALGDF